MFAPVEPNHQVISNEDLVTQFENIVLNDNVSKQGPETKSALGSGTDIKQDLDTTDITWSDLEEDLSVSVSHTALTTWDCNQVCKVCDVRKADTCIVHQHPDTHNCVCYLCALQHFRDSRTCPLCGKDIVYIYVYQDI